MDYITKKINLIDDIIRKNKNITEQEKNIILQALQLIHNEAKNKITKLK